MKKVSIALAVYNGRNYLAAQLESYLQQTRLPDELIAVDDGSTDETRQILTDFAQRVGFPVRIISNETNLGVIKSFEKAISACTGDIILLSDHDDVWLPSKVEKIAAHLEGSDNVGLVFSDARIVDEDLVDLGVTLFDRIFPFDDRHPLVDGAIIDVMLSRNVAGGATLGFKREFVPMILPIPTGYSFIHDGWIATVIAMIGKVTYIDEPLILYRQHRSQKSKEIWGSGRGRHRLGRLETYESALQFYSDRHEEILFLLDKCGQLGGLAGVDPVIWNCSYNALVAELAFSTDAIKHFKLRKSLAGFGRVLPIAQETARGRYHRFSNGFPSVVRDLFRI